MGRIVKKMATVLKVIIGRPADMRKFFNPTVARGKTVWPKTAADMLRYGIRFDYDGIIELDDKKQYHKYQMQPNAGDIPSEIRRWRDKNGGTHAVMGVLHIETGQTPDAGIFEHEMKAFLENLDV